MSKVLVKDIFSKSSMTGDVGIEIEVEAAGNLPNVNTKWWNTKLDNSLRNGLEYVTKGPIPVDAKKFERIKRLTDHFKPDTRVDKDSHRTSVHVHRNVLDKDVLEVWTLVTVGWLFENLLFKYCGPGREGNLFCLRLKDAEGVLRFIMNDINSGTIPFVMLETDSIRYSSQNLSAIPHYGSIEYRGMQGTVDPVTIDVWSSGLWEMGENANKYFSTPEAVLDYYFRNGWEKMARLIFSGPLLAFILNIKNAGDLVEENALHLTNLAYGTNWPAYHTKALKNMEKMVPKKKPTPMNISQAVGSSWADDFIANEVRIGTTVGARTRATNRVGGLTEADMRAMAPAAQAPRPWTINTDF